MDKVVLKNAQVATMVATGSAFSAGNPYGLIADATIAIENGRIQWVGSLAKMPEDYLQWPQTDLCGRLITPALIDCHTHLVYAGNRANEFEMRQAGKSYEEIARAGGGILSTVAATRQASDEALLEQSLKRVDSFIAEGVATLEVKSGYGLSVDDELRMLRVARQIAEERPVRIRTTLLVAHALPVEFNGHADKYIDEVCLPALEQGCEEGLVDAVDGFCESIGFSPVQLERLFVRATELGVPVKLHAEQLSQTGGASLVARCAGLSADHLEYLGEQGVEDLANSGSVAVLLPGAYYYLKETRKPPIELLRKQAVPMAVATDCNPGSSPMQSLLLAANMACVLFGLSAEEALAGITRNAAAAMGLSDTGVIAPGLWADLAIWDLREPAELVAGLGTNPLYKRLFAGKP